MSKILSMKIYVAKNTKIFVEGCYGPWSKQKYAQMYQMRGKKLLDHNSTI